MPSETHNTHLYSIFLIIGIVAIAGVVSIFSGQSSDPTGAALSASEQGFEKALVYGRQCGECGLADNKGKPLPSHCSEKVKLSPDAEPQIVYKEGEAQATAYCCRRRCSQTAFKKCQTTCTSAAYDVFTGRKRYSKSSASVPRSSAQNPYR